VTITDPCLRSKANYDKNNQVDVKLGRIVAPATAWDTTQLTGQLIVDGDVSFFTAPDVNGPKNSIADLYGNGYDVCGPLNYRFVDE